MNWLNSRDNTPATADTVSSYLLTTRGSYTVEIPPYFETWQVFHIPTERKPHGFVLGRYETREEAVACAERHAVSAHAWMTPTQAQRSWRAGELDYSEVQAYCDLLNSFQGRFCVARPIPAGKSIMLVSKDDLNDADFRPDGTWDRENFERRTAEERQWEPSHDGFRTGAIYP